MALLNSCDDIWYQSLPACADGFTVKPPGLKPETDYYWILTDKFGHIYSEVATTDAEGGFIITASEFPDGFFNEYAGQMELEIKGHPYYCEPLVFIFCNGIYTRFVIDFKRGDLPAILPCQC